MEEMILQAKAITTLQLAKPSISKLVKLKDPSGLVVKIFLRGEGEKPLKLMCEESWCEPGTWEYDFNSLADRKAKLADRLGMSSREVILNHPELRKQDDVPWYGSIIVGPYVISVSGFDLEHQDDAVCYLVGSILKMLTEDFDVEAGRKLS